MDYKALSRRGLFPFFLVTAGALAYLSSFSGVFLFDDRFHIVDNPAIRCLWPPGRFFEGTDRPLVQFSFALNYALSGLKPWSYHAFNLLIHLIAGLLLMGILRRTFRMPSLAGRYVKQADGLAFSTALLWLLHPIQTQSVTYIVQRAESMMGLFYFLTLYAVIRSSQEKPRAEIWAAVAVVACFSGMASKSVMVTAPIVVFLYDIVFIGGSWKETLRRRRVLYAGLAASWLFLILLWIPLTRSGNISVGFSAQISPVRYFLAQTQVIWHYLKLIFWPKNLVLDYAWPVPLRFNEIGISFLTVSMLGFMILPIGFHSRPLGFLCALFFILLLPTSSFFPLADLAAEHRLYLPLAVPLLLSVIGIYAFFDSVGKYKTFLTAKNSFPTQADFPLKNLDEVGTAMASSIDLGKAMQQRRYDDRREEFSCHLPFQSGRLKINLAAAAVLLFACLLGFLTFQRNQVYVSEEALWQDVIAKRPLNPRGHYGLGNVYFGRGEYDEAIRHYKEALRIKPDYVKPLNDLGLALFQQGQWAEAEAYFREAVRVMPDFPGTYNNLGLLYTRKGKFKEARDFFEEAIKISPSYAEAYNHLGIVLMNMGKTDEAVKSYEKALAIKPYYAEARNNLGNVLAQRGQWRQAIVYYRRALQDNPDFAGAYNNLGTAFAGLEEWPEAIAAYETALKIQPDFSEAKSNLKMAKGRQAASR